MVEMCQMVVIWCMKVYDGRSVSDGCQMVYDGVRWLYREGLSDGEDSTNGLMVEICQMVYMMVYDGRSVSDGCLMVYDGVGWLYRHDNYFRYFMF
jgi:hypothetical protein